MARPVRGCPTPQAQQKGAEEPETNICVPKKERQMDTTGVEVIADYDLDVNYEPKGSDPEIKAVHEEEENSDVEYAKMELSQDGTLHQRTMNCKVMDRIEQVHSSRV